MEIGGEYDTGRIGTDHLASYVAAKLSTFTGKMLSHPAFSGLGPIVNDLRDANEIGGDFKQRGDAVIRQMGPRSQADNVISEIPPEGVLIDQPGVYTLSPKGGDSRLTWSPTAGPAAAILILSSDVTLDLGSNNLSANIGDSSQHLVGIFVFAASNVTIRNGQLTNMCRYGIQAELVENLTIENVNISGLEYRNLSIRAACPCGIRIDLAKNVQIQHCQTQYIYASADACAGIQLINTLNAMVSHCDASHIANYAGVVQGFSYLLCVGVITTNCHASDLRSHFGGNLRTGGHTVLGFLPTLCFGLQFDRCSARNIVGSCDDCHGMSAFIAADVQINEFVVEGVTDGVTQFKTGAKATGLEIYGFDVQVANSRVNDIRAINPQDKLSTGFSVCGTNINLINCTASNVSVSNNPDDRDVLLGTGTGFGWAPDPRLSHTGATNVTYTNCLAANCQVAFDTWNHIDSRWVNPGYRNCAIRILVEPGGQRTLYGTPCTECNPPVVVTVHNMARNNVFPGSPRNPSPAIGYPYPTGNINGLGMPYALSRLRNVTAQWWFYVGLLRDHQNADHSFELTFIEPGNSVGEPGLSAVGFDFTFREGEFDFHATSTYGGNSLPQVVQSVVNLVGVASVVSADNDYRIDLSALSGFSIQAGYDAARSRPSASDFTGQLGQPGAAYSLVGQGSTWLWKFSESGEGEVAPFLYSIDVQLIDERGLVPEGLGSYVGIDPIRQAYDSGQSSVEYAQPRLRVVSWEIQLTRPSEPWLQSLWEGLEGFEQAYCYQGGGDSAGHIWLDRQALFTATGLRGHRGRALLSRTLSEAQTSLPSAQLLSSMAESRHPDGRSRIAGLIAHLASTAACSAAASAEQGKQLYLGCWLPVILTRGPYAGSTLLFVAFWKKARPIANYDTAEGDALPVSFMNLYTGLLGDHRADTHSAYTLSDLLNPAEAAGGTPSPENNYRIHFIKQFQSIGDLPDPQRWASEIRVTVKAHTQARYALAAYAVRAGRKEASGVGEDLVFTIRTVSRFTTTTTLSSDFGKPIFEGASRIYAEDEQEVGSGWVEQMVG